MGSSMKVMLMAVFASFLLAQNAYALQEIAGPLVIQTPIGGSNSARWGLINDGNETITVSLNATGDAAKYLSFPATVDLVPHKTVYTNITASIPADYSTSSGRNITGFLYALQEGKPGQVQINVQMMKSVTITVTGESVELKQTSDLKQTSMAENSNSIQVSPITSLAALVSSNYLAIVLIIDLILIAFAIFTIKKFKQFPRKH
jgi:hypothetical protein